MRLIILTLLLALSPLATAQIVFGGLTTGEIVEHIDEIESSILATFALATTPSLCGWQQAIWLHIS